MRKGSICLRSLLAVTSPWLLETTIRAGECLGPPRDYSKLLFFSQVPSLSSPLARPWFSASGLRLPHCCSLDHLPSPPLLVPRPGSSAPLFGLLPTLAAFSRHAPHDSWATIFRTDLMVSVSSLRSLCL